MSEFQKLVGDHVILRSPEEKDIDDRLECGRSYEWVRMFGGNTRNLLPLIREDAIKWFNFINSNPLKWVIEYEKKCIGTA